MKRRNTLRGFFPAVIAAVFGWTIWAHDAVLLAAPSVWRDQASGFAIGGYDPVAYYTRSKPTLGSEGLEHRWGGAVWQFTSVGNRDVFARYPEVYAPRFAGYDAFALSKGLTARGNPAVWVIYKGRVYLFRDGANLQAWRRERVKITTLAQSNWKRLGENLPGTSEW